MFIRRKTAALASASQPLEDSAERANLRDLLKPEEVANLKEVSRETLAQLGSQKRGIPYLKVSATELALLQEFFELLAEWEETLICPNEALDSAIRAVDNEIERVQGELDKLARKSTRREPKRGGAERDAGESRTGDLPEPSSPRLPEQ